MKIHVLRAYPATWAIGAALFLAAFMQSARGQNATWVGGNGGDPNEWVEPNNWGPATVPSGTATFTNTGVTSVANDAGIIIIGTIQFTGAPNAQAFTFSIDNPGIINATGVVNSSTNTQTFNITSGNSLVFQNSSSANSGTGAVVYNNESGGFLVFENTSNAGNANTTITNNSILQFDDSSSAGSAQITNNIELDFFNSSTAAGSTITNNSTGTLTFNNTSTASTAGITNSGSVQFNNSSTAGGAIIVNNGGGTMTFANSSSAGSSNITNNGTSTLTFTNTSTAGTAIITNNANVLFADTPTAASATIVNNSGGVVDISGLTNSGISIGRLSGAGNVNLGAKDLTLGVLNTNDTISGVISGAGGSLTKTGTGMLTLSGASTYSGGTTLNSGTLVVSNTTGSATGSGPVTVNHAMLGGGGTIGGAVNLKNGGVIEPGVLSGGAAGTTLTAGSMTWNPGGKVALQLGATSDQIALNGMLLKGAGAGSGFTFDLAAVAGFAVQDYTLMTFTSTNFLAGNFTLDLALPAGLTGTLVETATSLDLDVAVATITTGPLIQNSGPVNTPTNADFVVSGQVMTGSPTESNTIKTLTFLPGGSLDIFQTLYVTQGPVNLVGGSSITLENGNLSVGQLNILFGGLLNGNGSILGNLYNNGTVSPGDAPGQIHVSGNYYQGATGLLQIKIGGRGALEHDLLSVGGTAALGGTLQLVPLNGFKLQRNAPVTFLTASGGIIGRFANVEDGFTSDTILEPTVLYHSNSVAVEAVQGSFAQFADHAGLTQNQRSVARGLDSVANDPRANTLINFLDDESLNKLPRDFEKISPDQLTSIFTISTAYAQQQSLNLQRRTDDIRSGSSGFNAANLAINGFNPSYSGNWDATTSTGRYPGSNLGVAGPTGFRPAAPTGSGESGPDGQLVAGVSGPSGSDGKEAKETKEIAPGENRWGAFLSGTGEWVNVNGTENARGYDIASGGFTLGVDYKLTENFAIGLAAGYTGDTADLTDHGRVWVNGGKVGLYSTVFEGGWYTDMAAFGGYNGYDTRRSALEGDARGDTHGGEVDALFGTGYDFKKGNLTFGPTASFDYTYAGTSAFTEHDSLAPLNIHGGNADSLRTAFGGKISYDCKCHGVVIRPEVRVAWQHEYGDTTYDLTSSFANGAGGFNAAGPRLGRDSVLVGAGFAILFNERCSTYFYYDGELGRENYESNAVTGGFRIAF